MLDRVKSTHSISPMAPRAIVLYDGACGLCTGVAGLLRRRDRSCALRLIPIQGDEAAQELARIGARLPARWQAEPDSLLVIADGALLQRSDAVIEIARRLPPPWPWLRAVRAVPRPLRDGAYRLIARCRHALAGTRACALPSRAR